MTKKGFSKSIAVFLALSLGGTASAAVTKTELAGNPLADYPHFEYVKVINENAAVNIAIDPGRYPGVVGQTCRVYVVNAKGTNQWTASNTLSDVTPGGFQTETFSAGTVQANTFQVTSPSDLNGDAGRSLGVGYDVVLDCNQDGLLNGDDYIDGPNNESGFYVVDDLTALGPEAVTETDYAWSAAVQATFGIPATRASQNLFYPTNITDLASFPDPVPLIVISHGNGHWYEDYDHIGNHLASHGYVVMSHMNNTGPGSLYAADTTLQHTDALLDQLGAVAGGILAGRIDTNRIGWIGHSRGAEGVVIAYDHVFDGIYAPTHFNLDSIDMISSMLPTTHNPPNVADPHGANYHLWTASGDSDVAGSATSSQTYRLHDRGTGNKASTIVHGTGHAWYHNGGGFPWITGLCQLDQAITHDILLSHLFVLTQHFIEQDIASLDFMTRQYESFRPQGVPTGNVCIQVSHEYYDGAATGNVIVDDYQTQPLTNLSSSGAAVMFSVTNVTEDRLDDNNSDFSWDVMNPSSDPFNGAIQAGPADTSRGVVFDWDGTDSSYEWTVPVSDRDFTSSDPILDNRFLSFRGAQGTRHPNTIAFMGDLTFDVTLEDNLGTTSTINIGAYGGGGLEQPYDRSGGWHNVMETIRIRLNDFLNNGSGINLGNIVAVRLEVGPSHGANEGRVVIDDVLVTEDRRVYDAGSNGDPHLRTVDGTNYDFQSAGEFTLLRDSTMEIQARHTAVTTQGTIWNNHTELRSCVSLNTAVAARMSGRRVSYQPGQGEDPSPDGLELRIDGQLVDINAVGSQALGAFGRVSKAASGNGVKFEFPNGTILRATPHFWSSKQLWYLSLNVTNTPATEGVLGLISQGDWLPRRSDGTSLGGKPAGETDRYKTLYDDFSKSWHVTNANSLFDYGPGISTDDFTVVGWPPLQAPCEIPEQPEPPAVTIDVGEAARICRRVEDKIHRRNCTDDVHVTGDENFVRAYLNIEQDRKRATLTEVFADKKVSRVDDKRQFVATVKNPFSRKALGSGKDRDLGLVQFYLNGKVYGEPVRLDAFGRASIVVSGLDTGEYKVGAEYLSAKGNRAYYPSTSFQLDHVVAKVATQRQE